MSFYAIISSARLTFINFLELLAPILVAASLHPLMTPFLLSYIDNQSGLMAISKGYGSDPAINGVIAFFWSLMSALGWFPHFVWVPSHLNIAERRDVQLAQRLDWHPVEVDLTEVYNVLIRCASDLTYATDLGSSFCASPRAWWEIRARGGGDTSPDDVLVWPLGLGSNSTQPLWSLNK